MHIVRVMPLQQDAFYRTAMEGLQPGCGRTLAFLGNTAKRCLKGWRYEVQNYPTGTPSVVRCDKDERCREKSAVKVTDQLDIC
jgi:hypothetical protein